MATETLFTLPIPSSSLAESGGTIVCTASSPGVYLLTFTAPPDNRLITPFCQTFLLALDILEFSYPPGVLITTSGIGKFYSNGLNLEHASSTPGYWANSLFALWKRLLTCVSSSFEYAYPEILTGWQISYADSSMDQWARFCRWAHVCHVP